VVWVDDKTGLVEVDVFGVRVGLGRMFVDGPGLVCSM
jgi:hypothetical protein